MIVAALAGTWTYSALREKLPLAQRIPLTITDLTMKPSEERVQQLPHLVRLLMLLTAAVVLVLVVVLTKLYGPPAASTPVAVEDEATAGPAAGRQLPPPRHPGPRHGPDSAHGRRPPDSLRPRADCQHGAVPGPRRAP